MIMLLAALLIPGDSLPTPHLSIADALRLPGVAQAELMLEGPARPIVLPESLFTPRGIANPVPLAGGPWMPKPLSLPMVWSAGGTRATEVSPPEPQLMEYSDAYLTRLKIHKYASYATLPLFAAAYVTGNELIKNGGNAASWARNTHGAIAGSLGVLFAVNTITGVWNLYEGRHDPEGRTRRIIHSVLLLAADAGFLATAALAGESEGGEGGWEHDGGGDNSAHRAMAITSMGLAFTGYMTMSWPFRRN
jgi:hypothetical protein